MNIWTEVVVPLIVSVIASVVQLGLEYGVILRLRHTSEARTDLARQGHQSQALAVQGDGRYSEVFLIMVRVLTVFILSFGSVAVAATVGYEMRGMSGAVWGTIIGLALTLMAMWAILTWSTSIAKVASVLALLCLVALVLAGLVTFFADLVGLSLTFLQGLFLVLGLLLFIGIVVTFRIWVGLFPDSGLARWERGEVTRDREQ